MQNVACKEAFAKYLTTTYGLFQVRAAKWAATLCNPCQCFPPVHTCICMHEQPESLFSKKIYEQHLPSLPCNFSRFHNS